MLMKVKEITDAVDYPEFKFNGELFKFTIIGEFMILGPGQRADEMKEQLEKLSDDFELITAIRTKIC